VHRRDFNDAAVIVDGANNKLLGEQLHWNRID
jgi:hypothetical protein